MKYLTMTGFTVRTGSDRWMLGYEGENNSRTLQVKTTDDLTDFASVNLLIDTLDCGAMTVTTVGNYKVLSMVLTAGMLGEAGKKTCQLLMMDSEGTVIKKTNQFQMVVGVSNVIEGTVPESERIVIITDYIEEKVGELLGDIDDTVELHTEEIGELVTTLKNVGTHGRLFGLDWKNKNYTNLTTGNIADSTTRISLLNLTLDGLYKIIPPSNMDVFVAAIDPEWDGAKYMLVTGWHNSGVYIKTISGWKYSIVARYHNGSAIAPSAGDNVTIERVEENNDCDYILASNWKQGIVDESGVIDGTLMTRLSNADTLAFPHGGKYTVCVPTGFALGIKSGKTANNLETYTSWLRYGDTFTPPDEHIYFRTILAHDFGTSGQQYRTDFTPEKATGVKACLMYEKQDSVFTMNHETVKTIDAASLIFSTTDPNTYKESAVIAHTSDVHGDFSRLNRFGDFCDQYGVDFGAITGDLVAFIPTDGCDFVHDMIKEHDTLFGMCVGNHDIRSALTDSELYSYMFAPVATEIKNTNSLPYYYVDIEDKSLRIISINLYEYGVPQTNGYRSSKQHFAQAQITWLCTALASTPEGYGVLIMMHTSQGDVEKDSDYPVFYQDALKYSDTGISSISGGRPIYDIVDAYIGKTSINKTYTQTGDPSSFTASADFSTSNGEFIAYMIGHWHQDAITYVSSGTYMQLVLNVTCTNSLYGGDSYPYLCDLSDIPRNDKTATQDAFNVYVIDRTAKKVKVIRIGSDTTYEMAERKYAEYPYTTST